MSKYKHLQSCGLIVTIMEEKLRLSPVENVTDELREYVKEHKSEIMMEVLLDWYNFNRHTLNLSEDLFGYSNSKLSEPVELVDLILKEPADYWMRTNGDLKHCLQIIKRHYEHKGLSS